MDTNTAQATLAYCSIAVTILTLITAVALIWYTIETSRLRRATRDQVNATNLVVKETQKQNEQSLMPILVLTLQGDEGVFTVKNTGNGPALNIWIQPFSHGETVPMFHHSNAIGAGGQDEPVLRIAPNGKVLRPIEFKSLVNNALAGGAGPDVEFHTKISYQGVNKCWYQTSLTIKRTPGKFDPIIQFDDFGQIAGPPAEGTINGQIYT